MLACIAALLCLIPSRANTAPSVSRPASGSQAFAVPAAVSTASWPELLRNPMHTSLDPDPKLKASLASTLGINWMSALRSADLGSPVAAYNATLKKTIAYVGGERGYVTAYDESSGATVWSTSTGFGDSERATPMVAPDGSVWVATSYASTLYKLNGTTGAVMCSVKEAIRFDASPMFVTPPGGVPTVFIATNGAATINGPTLAIRESDCKTEWSFTGYLTPAGAWVTPAYGVDVTGRALIFEGTDDPDSTVYALDAKTGALVWHFTVANPPPGAYDIGSAATVSPPGVNGFADGVVYQISKLGVMYALNLRTGAELWEFNFNRANGLNGGGISSAALEGNMLVFGVADGVIALNASTGAQLWLFKDQTSSEVLSSPAIVGPTGDQLVTFGDAGGMFHALRLTDGSELYHYQTGGFITSSPAVIGGHILIDSTDGFLYDFALGGGNVASPTTAIASPVQGASVSNPNGTLIVQGSASDSTGLRSVQVSVQAGGPSGLWYNAATNTWVPGAVDNLVAVANPNSPQSSWAFPFPVPASGASYQVFANAVDVHGQVDRTGAQPTFSVKPSSTQPTITASALFVAPGGSLSVTGNAFIPGDTVVYTLQGQMVGSATARADGSVPAIAITVAAGDAFGLTSLTATGNTSGSTTTPLDITNMWSQSGYGAMRTSFEPNDLVFQNTLQATGHGYVSRAWLFMTGAAVDASPAVAAGNAYVGNDAGTMSAVDTISGAPLWTYTTPTGAAIHAAPAVDMNAGLLFFGSDDGVLYTLSASSGAFIGSAALDGIPTAPALTSGRLYLGTDAGTVLAMNETTGAGIWSTSLGAAVHSPPAIDAAKSILVVGDDSGAITALNSATGAKLWSMKTGNAVTASPAIGAGIVYAGSTDGSLYAINETTGTLSFRFAAGSPIHAGAVLAGGAIQIGTDGGILYDLSLSGKVKYQTATYQNPIVGIGSSSDVPWVETSTGVIGASKNDQNGRQVYGYRTGAGLSTAPTVLDGAVYVGAEDGGLYAFTPYGSAPANSRVHQLAAARAKAHPPARWTHAVSIRRSAIPTRSFEPFGPREFPMHLDRSVSALSGAIVAHGGPVQTAPHSYLIYWAPAGTARPTDAATSAAALRSGSAYTGWVVDTATYPRRLDDAAVQREITREIAVNHWNVDINAQVFVVTGSGATASKSGFCAYHSAFDLNANLSVPVPYAFVPNLDAASGCGTLDRLLHREQTELRTDPFLNGLHSPSGAELTQ